MSSKLNKGYIMLSSILVILAVVVVIGISTSLLSVNDLLSSNSGEKGEAALDFVESCAEDALLYLNENNSLPSSVTILSQSCNVNINSQVGNNWDFNVTGIIEGNARSFRIKVIRDSTLTVTSWTEI